MGGLRFGQTVLRTTLHALSQASDTMGSRVPSCSGNTQPQSPTAACSAAAVPRAKGRSTPGVVLRRAMRGRVSWRQRVPAWF